MTALAAVITDDWIFQAGDDAETVGLIVLFAAVVALAVAAMLQKGNP